MLLNLLFWLALVALAGLLGWLAWRSRRIRNRVLRRGSVVLNGALALLLSVLSAVTLTGLVRAYAPRTAPVPDLKVAGTPEQVARGKHLANVFCAGCHALNGELPLTGGVDLGNDLPIPLGNFVSTNLTPAGPLKEWTDGEIFRAIRNGLDREGRWLFVMATAQGRNLSDKDIEALIAYIRSQPTVEHDTPNPPDKLSPLGIVMLGTGAPGRPAAHPRRHHRATQRPDRGIRCVHLQLSGLHVVSWGRFAWRCGGPTSTDRAEPVCREKLDGRGIHHHAAHRCRPKGPCA
jgi:mono/diheme cytochrome c family protein